LAHIDAVCY